MLSERDYETLEVISTGGINYVCQQAREQREGEPYVRVIVADHKMRWLETLFADSIEDMLPIIRKKHADWALLRKVGLLEGTWKVLE